MHYDIEEIKNKEKNANPQSEGLENAFKTQVNTLLSVKKTIDTFPLKLKNTMRKEIRMGEIILKK